MRGWIATSISLLLGLAACGEEEVEVPSGPTHEEQLEICRRWRNATCERFVECSVGLTFQECIDDAALVDGTCEEWLATNPCYRNNITTIAECADEVPMKSCDDLCHEDGNCFAFCFVLGPGCG